MEPEPNGERWVNEMRWPDKADGPFALRLTFGLIDERPEVVGVELWAVEPPETVDPLYARPGFSPTEAPIRSADLRLPLRHLLEEWKARRLVTADLAARAAAMSGRPDWWPAFQAEAIRTGHLVGAKRKGRADAHGPEHWEAVADVYLRSGTSGVARTFLVSKGTAGKWVWIARHEKQLLDPTEPGKMSGRSTSIAGTSNKQGATRTRKGRKG